MTSSSADVMIGAQESEEAYLKRLLHVIQREMARAADAAPRQHLNASSTLHSAYTRSVLQKIEAIERCVTPRTREKMKRFAAPDSSASPQALFAMADRAGIPLRRVAALRAIFASRQSNTDGIPEEEFVSKFGASIDAGGNSSLESKYFWCRSLDRNSDGTLSANEIFNFLTMATDIKSSADLAAWFEIGTQEQIPKMAISAQVLEQLTGGGGNGGANKKSKSKQAPQFGGRGGAPRMSALEERRIEQETLERQRRRREYEESFDANTRKRLAEVTASEFERADSSSTAGQQAAAAAAAAAAALGTSAEPCHHRGQIVRIFYVPETNHIFTAADDGLVIAWDPDTLNPAEQKPVHRGARAIVDAVQDPYGRAAFFVLQDDGVLFLYGVREDRASDAGASVRLLNCYAPESLSSLEKDGEGKAAYPGVIVSRVLATKLLPAVEIEKFGASSFITAIAFLPPDPTHNDFLCCVGTQAGNVCLTRFCLASSTHRTEVYHVMQARSLAATEAGSAGADLSMSASSADATAALSPASIHARRYRRHAQQAAASSALHTAQVTRIVVLHGRHLFCSTSIDGTLCVCDHERRCIVHRLLPGGAPPLARPLLSVACCSVNYYAMVWAARAVSVWDVVTGVRVAMLESAQRVVDVVVDSSEDRLCFVLLTDKSVNVFSTRTWRLVGQTQDGAWRPMFDRLAHIFWWRERGLLMSGCSVPFAWRRRISEAEKKAKQEEAQKLAGTKSAAAAASAAVSTNTRLLTRAAKENLKRSHAAAQEEEQDEFNDGADTMMSASALSPQGTKRGGGAKLSTTILPTLLCSKSGGHLVGCGPETVHVWSARDAEEFNVWHHDASDVVTACAIDPDGLRIVIGTESRRVIFCNYCKGYNSVELGHSERGQGGDGIVALQIASGGDASLRLVCAALPRKLLLWARDTQLFHHIAQPDYTFELPPEVDGGFSCLAVVHNRRRIFATGTSAGRVILFSDNLSVLNHFDMSRTPLQAIQQIVAVDVENGMFVAAGIRGHMSLFAVRRISNDAFMILRCFQTTPLCIPVNEEGGSPSAAAEVSSGASFEQLLVRTCLTPTPAASASIPFPGAVPPPAATAAKKSALANALARLRAAPQQASSGSAAAPKFLPAAALAIASLDGLGRTIAVGDSAGNISVIGLASLASKNAAAASTLRGGNSASAVTFILGEDKKQEPSKKELSNDGDGDGNDGGEPPQGRSPIELGLMVREGAGSALFKSGATTLLHCCFKAHTRGVHDMCTTHVPNLVFSVGEDNALRLWRFDPQRLHLPWTPLKELAYPTSAALPSRRSIARFLPFFAQAEDGEDGELEFKNREHSDALLRTHPLYHAVDDDENNGNAGGGGGGTRSVQLPSYEEMSGTSSLDGRLVIAARSLDTVAEETRKVKMQEHAQRAFASAATAVAATMRMKQQLHQQQSKSAAPTRQTTTAGLLVNEHYTSPFTAQSAPASISALRAQQQQALLLGNRRAVRKDLPPLEDGAPRAASMTPQPSRAATVAALAAARSIASGSSAASSPPPPPVFDEKRAFERITGQIARAVSGTTMLVANTYGDEKIATAVRDIDHLQRAKEGSHVGKVEPPRAFSRMNVDAVDHIAASAAVRKGRKATTAATALAVPMDDSILGPKMGAGPGVPLPIAAPLGLAGSKR